MRLALVLPLLAALAGAVLQKTKPQEEPASRGLPGLRQAENARIEEELVGTWTLLEYRSPREVIERRDFSGFASFQNGFFTFLLRLDVLDETFLGPKPQTIVQAGVHRYRIEDGLHLQTATVMGFSNETDDFELQGEPTSFPREFEVTLEDDRLSLRRWDGLTLVFARADATGTFPPKAAEALERNRGRRFTPPADWNRRR